MPSVGTPFPSLYQVLTHPVSTGGLEEGQKSCLLCTKQFDTVKTVTEVPGRAKSPFVGGCELRKAYGTMACGMA